jgi:hypothetical protein
MKKSSIFVIIFFAVLGLAVGAVVTQAADSLTGTWKLAVDSELGKGTPTFVLQQDGEDITGTTGTDKGEVGISKLTGRIQGSYFEIAREYNGKVITYKGKVEGNKISGSIVFGSRGRGRSLTGTFTGEKQ